MEFEGSRTLERSFKVVELAKLDPESLQPCCQALRFAENDIIDNVTLMEVTQEVADQLEEGQKFVFRGEANDSVVLCSDQKVYDVKEAETSNSLLLVQNLLKPQECSTNPVDNQAHQVTVSKTIYRYLEMKPARPGYRKLADMLDSKLLKSFQDFQSSSWPYSDLLDKVQCSEGELKEGLKEMEAVEHEGSWTKLDPDLRMKIVSMICNVISENSWSWENVEKDEVLETLKELESEVLLAQVFDQVFIEGKVQSDKLCRFYGEYLLQSSSVFNLKEFLNIWQESMPVVDFGGPAFKVDLKQLEGLAVLDKDQIRYFPEAKLPTTVQERLSVLFDTKEKWRLDEITPFVINLTTPKLNVKGLLTKYARGSKVKDVQLFSSKHQN